MLLLSSIVLTAIMGIGIGVISYEAWTIRNAEKLEAAASTVLNEAEQWLNHQNKIEVAAKDYALRRTSESIEAIARNRRDAAEHEVAMKNILDEYSNPGVDQEFDRLRTIKTTQQQLLDEVVERARAKDLDAVRGLLASDKAKGFAANAESIIDRMTSTIRAKRELANQSASQNAERVYISFILMSVLIFVVIWCSYIVARGAELNAEELSDQLIRKATHDGLTQLPNRDLFNDRLSQSISLARRNHQHLALLFVDLDGFKAINDTYGHQIGDATLKETARRLRGCVREADTVARLGGDEFAIILNDIQEPAAVGHLADKIIRNVSDPMPLYGDKAYHVGASIGIAIYPSDGIEIDRLMRSADRAMYESKSGGKNRYTYSTASEALSSESWISFVDDFSVGVQAIDEQHEALADMLNDLNSALAIQAPRSQLLTKLGEFISYTALHFQTEEQLMERFTYPDFEKHRAEHQRLIAEVRHLKARFEHGGELLVLQWLKDWLIGHVAGSDRKLSEYLIRAGIQG